MARGRGAGLVAVGAQVVVVADQTLVAPAAEVAPQTRVAADTCRGVRRRRSVEGAPCSWRGGSRRDDLCVMMLVDHCVLA